MKSPIEPTILPATEVDASATVTIPESGNFQQNHEADVEIATRR